MLEIKENSKVRVIWSVSTYDYSPDKEKDIVEKIASKYHLQKKNIEIVPEFIIINNQGKELTMSESIISNIQDKEFQLKLFKDYLTVNGITDYDFELIKSFDAKINSKINYDIYEKYKRYKIKWVKWDNFLSYGEGNYFDFEKLNGLVLIQGMSPYGNQTGKTTFSIDLLHFLLFGNTTKYKVQSDLFNKHLPKSTEIMVEGCMEIDGNDYIIKRTLTRPSFEKRNSRSKTSQKVEYYKLVGNNKYQLSEVEAESRSGESVMETNKIIKESIGTESDFDIMISTTMSNLQDLISLKSTERGQLFSKWIGLLPLENKDELARSEFNTNVKPYLLGNRFNKETLENEIKAFEISISEIRERIKGYESNIISYEKDISEVEAIRKIYLSSLTKIDENLLKIDINTLNKTIERILDEGKKKKEEIESIEKEIKDYGDVKYSLEEHKKKEEEKDNALKELMSIHNEIYNNNTAITSLEKGEYCPTCGRKYDNIDNTVKIKELREKNAVISENEKEKNKKLEGLKKELESFHEMNEKYMKLNQMQIKMASLKVKKEQLLNEYMINKNLLTEFNKNGEAIKKNNDLEIKIRNTDETLKDRRSALKNVTEEKIKCENLISNNEKDINDRRKIIDKLKEEEKTLRNWKIYLDMVGKNGIIKMVLREALPIINANIAKMLSGICDFDVKVDMNEKNEVALYLIKDGVYSDLSSGSGFELTCSSLALRAVLANISTIPRANFFVADEVLGAVWSENMENMHQLFLKISKDYDFILNVTHDETIKDWFDHTIMIKKENNISKIVKVE